MFRFAFNPTKDIDIENLRVALINHIVSKQKKQELIIRIDDSQRLENSNSADSTQAKQKQIIETLTLFGIDYSRVVAQSENIKYHTGMGMKLLLDKKAFNCFCSDEALQQDRQKAKEDGVVYSYSGFCETISDEAKFQCNAPFVVRMKKPDHAIHFRDILKGECAYEPLEVDSCIILTHEKVPTHNFACAIDDMLYDICMVICEEDLINDVPKQIHIRESLEYVKKIDYLHLPKIIPEDKIPSVKELVDSGYLPIAIANYLILLGYETPKEIFTIEEAVEWFDMDKISKESPKFDREKLNFINQEHMNLLEDMRFSKIIGFADVDIGKLAKLYIKECNTTQEIKEKIDLIFRKKIAPKDFEEEFETLTKCLQQAPFINEFDQLEQYIIKKTNLKDEKLFIPLSVALTGTTKTQNISEIYPHIRNYLGEII